MRAHPTVTSLAPALTALMTAWAAWGWVFARSPSSTRTNSLASTSARVPDRGPAVGDGGDAVHQRLVRGAQAGVDAPGPQCAPREPGREVVLLVGGAGRPEHAHLFAGLDQRGERRTGELEGVLPTRGLEPAATPDQRPRQPFAPGWRLMRVPPSGAEPVRARQGGSRWGPRPSDGRRTPERRANSRRSRTDMW